LLECEEDESTASPSSESDDSTEPPQAESSAVMPPNRVDPYFSSGLEMGSFEGYGNEVPVAPTSCSSRWAQALGTFEAEGAARRPPPPCEWAPGFGSFRTDAPKTAPPPGEWVPCVARTLDMSTLVPPPPRELTPVFGSFGADILKTAPPSGEWVPCLGNKLEMSTRMPPPPSERAPVFALQHEAPPPSAPAFEASLPVLSLSQALEVPELGTPELPTVGSSGHHVGNCKPCAFFYTRGCGSGVDCAFCHLCPPGEKKKRRIEKKEFRRAVAQLGGITPGAHRLEM